MRKPVLYSFRRCPYAMRARWALINYDIKVILREVELKNKPNELLEVSSKGTVPVLITSENTVIDQSLEIMEWAFYQYSNNDSFKYIKSKEDMILIEENDTLFKYHLDRYKYPNRYTGNNLNKSKVILKETLLKWNNLISRSARSQHNGWLSGKAEGFADWAIWPFVRQYRMVNSIEFDNDYSLDSIKEWLNYYTSHRLFPILMMKHSPWNKQSNEIFLTTRDSLNNLLL